MDSLKEIIQTMEALLNAHSKLHELTKEKSHFLVVGNILELQNMNNRESSCLDDIQKLEHQRKRLVHDYMNHKGYTGQSYTLDELSKIQVNSAEMATLKSIAKQLRALIQEISHMNESNQQLIQTSLSYVQYSIGLHVRKEPALGYGPYAKKRYLNLLDAKI